MIHLMYATIHFMNLSRVSGQLDARAESADAPGDIGPLGRIRALLLEPVARLPTMPHPGHGGLSDSMSRGPGGRDIVKPEPFTTSRTNAHVGDVEKFPCWHWYSVIPAHGSVRPRSARLET